MGDCKVGGSDGVTIESVAQMFGRFSGELFELLPGWQQRLHEDPQDLDEIELKVHRAFTQGAGQIVGGLIAVVMASAELEQAAEQTRKNFSHPLAKGRKRSIRVKLLGGFMMWISSLYCEPRRGMFRQADDQASGVYIEMTQFGFGKKVSPGLESQVARQSALCPSFQLARAELERSGTKLNLKTVRRIAQQCGDKLLQFRTIQLQQWRAGTLPAGDELAGKRVTVQIDGGRTKLREVLKTSTPAEDPVNEDGLVISDAPGRSKPTAKRTFCAEWREPKLMTIFIHNDQGRMVKKSEATIDGTFTGPDAMAELVAMHLHRLGAAQAQSITFVSDGAVWIWDRIDRIVSQAGISTGVSIYQVLDNCHATHHVSLALATLGVSVETRMPLYRDLRTQLRNGQWKDVVGELQQFADDDPHNTELQTELAYLNRHGAAGRLNYATFKKMGLPVGSGAIESSIRRVINLRLKGNGIFWKEENAESMLQLRSLVISNRWDDHVGRMRRWHRDARLADWRWQPQPMSSKTEPQTPTPQITA
jgi:hypothetical protein